MSRERHSPETMRRFGGGGISAFAEMLVIGLGITALALPLVTLVPALAAGTRHLDEHLEHRGDSLRDLFRLGWQAIRAGWLFGLASLAVLALLLINVALGLQGLVPGGAALAVVSGVLAVVVAVVVCRVASLWSPGRRWADLWRSGRTLAIDDPIGSFFVLLGILVSVTVVWMLPPLIVIAPGLLAVSIVAAERRRRAVSRAERV
ncbi:hypothetical protein [Microbacterium murale]|uniref:Poxvirus protein I5 n=1 Tax=Microbacterium murale TaxID=1081040 RepID=A0ABU0PCJ5_9MICO|nr:hypothetical protein [Microbacterium murale]MDQ0644396.1 hypothetical protein [Microbacterium murale]